MTSAQLSNKTLRYISTVAFRIAPMSASTATTSLRLLLSAMPFKPPSGVQSIPQTTLTTVPSAAEQDLEVTYADKKRLSIKPDGMTVADMIRRIEAPAKLLRAKEEGL